MLAEHAAVTTTRQADQAVERLGILRRAQQRQAWRLAAAELDGYRRGYGLDDPGPAKHVGGRMARDGRAGVAATPSPASRPTKPASSQGAVAVAGISTAAATSAEGRRRPIGGIGSTLSGCWAANPAGRPPAGGATGSWPGPRSTGWPAGTATARTATSGPWTATGPVAIRTARLAATSATADSWQKGAAHGPGPHPRP